jgi:hypothetical protein
MKTVSLGPESLGNINMEDAFNLMFNKETLLMLHGSSLQTTEWHNKKRVLKFNLNVDNIPKELRHIFCGSQLKLTTKQEMFEKPNEINIVNKVRLHFLGAEFLKIKPIFTLNEINGEIFFSGNIEHHAIFPPPLNKIAENLMSLHTKRELDHYRDIIKSLL